MHVIKLTITDHSYGTRSFTPEVEYKPIQHITYTGPATRHERFFRFGIIKECIKQLISSEIERVTINSFMM